MGSQLVAVDTPVVGSQLVAVDIPVVGSQFVAVDILVVGSPVAVDILVVGSPVAVDIPVVGSPVADKHPEAHILSAEHIPLLRPLSLVSQARRKFHILSARFGGRVDDICRQYLPSYRPV